MDCDRTTERLPWLLNGSLDPEETAAVRRHLADCELCQKELSETRLAGQIFGAHLPTPAVVAYAFDERDLLTAVTTGLLFLACLFLAPLAQSVPSFATAAALLFVACLMARGLADLPWDDLTEAAPAVVTALAMPLFFSVADGIGIGFIVYALVKLISGRAGEAPAAVWLIAGIFGLKFAFL